LHKSFEKLITEEEAAYLTPEGATKPVIHKEFLLVVIFKAREESELTNSLECIPQIQFMKKIVVKKSLI
jgi:hypothetical protein